MIARNTCSPSREIAAHHQRNAQAAQESVDDRPRMKQIGQWREAAPTVSGPRCGRFVNSLCCCFPISPARGNERAAAIWKHYQQQQSAAALDGAHKLQWAALKRMPLTLDGH